MKNEGDDQKKIVAPQILQPGKNCWRLAQAQRSAFIIDGASYFAAFRAAALKARRAIYIIGWDIHSSVRLLRDRDPDDDLPPTLGEFLNALLKRRRELEVYVLAWDFAMLYASDREILPLFRPVWTSHRRMHYKLDAAHPVGGSHHQKIVVIDDKIAFVGGLDLTWRRWDTPEHRPDDPRRTDAHGEHYGPFHDVQMLVDGEAASALGELARERWRRGVGKILEPPSRIPEDHDPWPSSIKPAVHQVEIAIARTEPRFNSHPQVSEIKGLYLDAIASARRFIYIENQYLTSTEIVEALVIRLQESEGPEVVILSRLSGGAWLEEVTMKVLRARLINRLRAVDRHRRLGVFYPHHRGLDAMTHINLHSKLMIVDDRFVRIGSANLANRSMGYDTECDLAFTAVDETQVEAITLLRRELLGEHLAATVEEIAGAEEKHGSLLASIESMRGRERTLEPLEDKIPPEIEAMVPQASFIDPEEPIDPDRIVREFLPPDHRRSAESRVLLIAGALVAIAALVLAWRTTLLGDWLEITDLRMAAATLRESGAFLILGGFVAGTLVLVPAMLLVVATVALFGPLLGFTYAWGGLLLASCISYWLGRRLPRNLIRRLAGKRLNKVSQRLARGGLPAVLAVRLVPIAHFTVVNIVAGSSRVKPRHFLLGTALGVLPGLAAATLVADRIREVLQQPGPLNMALLGGAAVLVTAGATGIVLAMKRLDRKDRGTVA